MPTKTKKSPFATSFNSLIKRGVPCWTAVQQIAKRTGKNPTFIFTSLFNAGCCWRQKVNGQWCYWPVTSKKSSSASTKQCQFICWQNFMDWCLASGVCTSKQFKIASSNPTKFFNFLCNCWSKNFGKSTTVFGWSMAPKAKSTTKKSKWNKRTKRSTKSYRFPNFKAKKSSTTRKYRYAA